MWVFVPGRVAPYAATPGTLAPLQTHSLVKTKKVWEPATKRLKSNNSLFSSLFFSFPSPENLSYSWTAFTRALHPLPPKTGIGGGNGNLENLGLVFTVSSLERVRTTRQHPLYAPLKICGIPSEFLHRPTGVFHPRRRGLPSQACEP